MFGYLNVVASLCDLIEENCDNHAPNNFRKIVSALGFHTLVLRFTALLPYRCSTDVNTSWLMRRPTSWATTALP